MSDEAKDSLDQLLVDWAAARQADDQHTRRLADGIVSAARQQAMQGSDRSTARVSPIVDRLRPTSNDVASMPAADWGGRLMIGGGGLLLSLVLLGSVLWYNLTTSPGITSQPGSTIPSTGNTPSETIASRDLPLAAVLDATVIREKRQLLTEANGLFDNQLAWIADGQRNVAFEVCGQAAPNHGQFMLVRVVVAQRASAESPWSTVWQTDVISRNEMLVEIGPKQLDGSSLVLWTYLMPGGEVAIDMDLQLDQFHLSSRIVLQVGEAARVDCLPDNESECCIFQSVISLDSSGT